MAHVDPADNTPHSLLTLLAEIKFSWFSSVRPDGRPHSVPICHVMHAGAIYVATPSTSVKVANVQTNPHVQIAAYLEDPEAGLIVEGIARLRQEYRAVVTGLFEKKYEWDLINDHRHNALIEITPARLTAWGQYGEGRWSGEEIRRTLRGEN